MGELDRAMWPMGDLIRIKAIHGERLHGDKDECKYLTGD